MSSSRRRVVHEGVVAAFPLSARALFGSVLVACVVAASAVGARPAFIRGALYRGTSSQKGATLRIRIAANGRTARVGLGTGAQCNGAGRYQYGFVAEFDKNPARIHGSNMAVDEIDRNLPADHQVPAATVVHQRFAAHATGNGHTLAGTYELTETLTDGRRCTTGRVTFDARTS